jgi:hypothetical protein
MPTLIITAHHNTYNGTTFGVKFEAGRAVLNEHSNPNRFGYTLEQLCQKFSVDLPGYSAEWIGDPLPEQVAPSAPAQPSALKHLTPAGKKKARPKTKREPVPEAG